MRQIVKRRARSLKPNPHQLRQGRDRGELRTLGQSVIKKQRVPLLIRSDDTILDGDGRCAGVMMIDPDFELDCIVIDGDVSADEAIEIQLVTALRADLKPYEMYLGCVEWLKHHAGATAKELALAIDRSEAAVSMTLSLFRCIKPVQEAAAQGKIGIKDWNAISQVAADQQEAMLAAKLNGASSEQLKRLRKSGGEQETVKVTRIKCEVPGRKANLTISGQDLSLSQAIEIVQDWLREAKKAAEQGLSAKSFERVCKDRAQGHKGI